MRLNKKIGLDLGRSSHQNFENLLIALQNSGMWSLVLGVLLER